MKISINLGAILFACSFTLQAADMPIPAQAATCTACHGEQGQGNSVLGTPRLAGQHANYLSRQLHGFKQGQRGYDAGDQLGAQMRAIAAALTDADIDQVAEYYAGLSLAVPEAAQAKSTQGEALYQHTCAACHGPAAEGFSHLSTPNLRILDATYMERQLEHFTQGSRGGDGRADQLGIWMRGVALQIEGAKERQAILDYIVNMNQH